MAPTDRRGGGGASLREWLAVASALAAFAVVIGAGSWTWRLDQSIFDTGLALAEHPAHPGIVIVAIDEPSLQSVGRWPWPRKVHAGILERIAADKPKAVGIDVGFTEPQVDDPEGDRRLADAARRTPGLVLPVMIEGTREMPPLPALREAARLAHVNVWLDADGILRSIELRRPAQDGSYDHMALAMLRAARDEAGAPGPGRLNLAFAGPPGQFRRVSAGAVLRGEVPPGTFAGKYVLVGATAIGLGDNFSTPSTVRGGPMPGVEVIANTLDNLLTGRSIARASPWTVGLVSALAVLCLLAIFAASGPRTSLWSALGAAFGAPIAAFVVLGAADFWFAPMTFVAAALVAYPLWSWRKLEAALRYLDEELARLRDETGPMSDRRKRSGPRGDFLRRRIDAVRAAVGMMRNARRFISDSLDGLPHAALVAGLDAKVAIANRLAATLGTLPQPGQPLVDLLAPLTRKDGATWEGAISQALRGSESTAESASADGREFLVRLGPFRDGAGEMAGLIVIAEDVTSLRQAQRERDETLSFVSHDLRSPQASILALVELQGIEETRMPESEFNAKIEQLAWKTVTLAEDFVHLTRADSMTLAPTRLDLAEVASACAQDIAPQAAARHISVVAEAPDGPVLVDSDRSLVSRALTNLLSNAIKYSGEGTRVLVSVQRAEGFAVCKVQDQGVGISEADRARLFKHFQRIEAVTRATRAKGIGLGLVFVETVARRHGGKVTVASEQGKGSCFSLWLPLPV